jgi:hypothetical protein
VDEDDDRARLGQPANGQVEIELLPGMRVVGQVATDVHTGGRGQVKECAGGDVLGEGQDRGEQGAQGERHLADKLAVGLHQA